LEQQEECEYFRFGTTFFKVFIFFHGQGCTYYVYDQFPNHFKHTFQDGCIDNYIFLVDHNQDALNPAIQLSYNQYSENETVTLGGQELLTQEQEGYLFSSKGECMYEQLSFLNQHDSDHGFEDPVAVLLESYFSDPLKISDFIMSPTFVGEYGFLKESISLWLYFCYYLLISGKRWDSFSPKVI
jgi:hypothetical protein